MAKNERKKKNSTNDKTIHHRTIFAVNFTTHQLVIFTKRKASKKVPLPIERNNKGAYRNYIPPVSPSVIRDTEKDDLFALRQHKK